MGAGDAAVFSYYIGLFRGFQRAMETDEVCGRPLDPFAVHTPVYWFVLLLRNEKHTN